MKTLVRNIRRAACICLLGQGLLAADLHVEVVAQWQNGPLTFDQVALTDASGQQLSVTRLDMLLSEFALRSIDGRWTTLTNSCAYINGREGRKSFVLRGVTDGAIDRVRFLVGVHPELNHADPVQFGPEHPLNPNLNGLHWNWQGGYVFLALEGLWKSWRGSYNSPLRGFSWHLATDRQLATVEIPVEGPIANGLKLILDVGRLFSVPNRIVLNDETSSTHSRKDDPLAEHLRQNLEQAFRASATTVAREMAASIFVRGDTPFTAKPFPFTYPAHFPQPALPTDNPLTVEGVELGRRLFNDPLLSINDSQSCASCHQADAAFTDSGKRFSRGAEGRFGARNSMPLANLAWKSSFFWDGRARSLREQVLMPIENPVEMHESLTNVARKLKASSATRYEQLFEQAFGTPEITPDRIARALEQYLVSETSFDTRFDRVLKNEATLTEEEKRGFELFHTEYDPRRGQFGADCFHCHGGPLFQSQSFANNGLDVVFADSGRQDATKRDGDKGKFAVPSLRNVELTAPYMHDGRFATLEEVVEHYSTGVKRSATLDPNVAKHPDGGVPLSTADKKALIAFLKTLTDSRFSAEVQIAAP